MSEQAISLQDVKEVLESAAGLYSQVQDGGRTKYTSASKDNTGRRFVVITREDSRFDNVVVTAWVL